MVPDPASEERPRVTVGIPTYNCAATIERTLQSLLGQTRPPDRIVVVDASTDSTPGIVTRVSGEAAVTIDLFEQSEDGLGVGRARQDIYERFDGDLLVCLDTNLIVDEEWLARRIEFHEQNPDFGVLSGSPLAGVDGEVTSGADYLRQANCSFQRSALDRVNGWDPWFPRGEDWDLNIRLRKAGVRAYARSDLAAEPIDEEAPNQEFHKLLNRPSSVPFVLKYGFEYFADHPSHPLGDTLSGVSYGLITWSIAAKHRRAAVRLLPVVFVAAFATVYAAVKLRRRKELRDVTPRDLSWFGFFFLLGPTALYNVRRFWQIEGWNYGGLD